MPNKPLRCSSTYKRSETVSFSNCECKNYNLILFRDGRLRPDEHQCNQCAQNCGGAVDVSHQQQDQPRSQCDDCGNQSQRISVTRNHQDRDAGREAEICDGVAGADRFPFDRDQLTQDAAEKKEDEPETST